MFTHTHAHSCAHIGKSWGTRAPREWRQIPATRVGCRSRSLVYLSIYLIYLSYLSIYLRTHARTHGTGADKDKDKSGGGGGGGGGGQSSQQGGAANAVSAAAAGGGVAGDGRYVSHDVYIVYGICYMLCDVYTVYSICYMLCGVYIVYSVHVV